MAALSSGQGRKEYFPLGRCQPVNWEKRLIARIWVPSLILILILILILPLISLVQPVVRIGLD